jgi:hypothetical protein
VRPANHFINQPTAFKPLQKLVFFFEAPVVIRLLRTFREFEFPKWIKLNLWLQAFQNINRGPFMKMMISVLAVVLVSTFSFSCRTTTPETADTSETKAAPAVPTAQPKDMTKEEWTVMHELTNGLETGDRMLHVCAENPEFPQYQFFKFEKITNHLEPGVNFRLVPGYWGSKFMRIHFMCLQRITTGPTPILWSV